MLIYCEKVSPWGLSRSVLPGTACLRYGEGLFVKPEHDQGLLREIRRLVIHQKHPFHSQEGKYRLSQRN